MNNKKDTSFKRNFSEKEMQILEERLRFAIQEKKIAELEKNLDRKHPVLRITGNRIFRAAAFWTILVSLTFIVYKTIENGDKGIFNRYYAPYNTNTVTGIYRGMESGLYTPYYLYTEQDYYRALSKFRQYLEVNPSDIQANLLLAVCLIEEKKFREAETELTKIVHSGNFYFTDDANWYLALLAVRNGDFMAAKLHLGQIQKRIYSDQVQSLLKSIEDKKLK